MVVDLQQECSVEQFEAACGGPIHETDSNRCCFERKIKVLQRVSQGFDAWMSGIRRDQSPHRAGAPIVGWDKKFGLVKISPLANWTSKQVWKRIIDEQIPYNPLHDQGYPSIGCRPCTRRCCSARMSGQAAGAAPPRPNAGCTPPAISLDHSRGSRRVGRSPTTCRNVIHSVIPAQAGIQSAWTASGFPPARE